MINTDNSYFQFFYKKMTLRCELKITQNFSFVKVFFVISFNKKHDRGERQN